MKTISIADSVVISTALRSEIRECVRIAQFVLESGADVSPFIQEITALIHAYNAVNFVPYTSSHPFLRRYFNF